MVIWNIRKIFLDANGSKGLQEALNNGDCKVSLGTVRAWEGRGSIPPKYMAVLVHQMDVDARDWIIEDLF